MILNKYLKDIHAKVKGYIFRLKCMMFNNNVKIGKGLKLYCKISIKGNGTVIIGENCSIWSLIGAGNKYVTLYTHAPDALLKIGNDVKLIAARFGCKYLISIGDNVIIEDSSIMDTDFHSIDISRGEIKGESKEVCKIVIGNSVKIGVRSIIMKGVKIGDDSVVLPCSVVRQSIPACSVVLGNPARQIKNYLVL